MTNTKDKIKEIVENVTNRFDISTNDQEVLNKINDAYIIQDGSEARFEINSMLEEDIESLVQEAVEERINLSIDEVTVVYNTLETHIMPKLGAPSYGALYGMLTLNSAFKKMKEYLELLAQKEEGE